MKRIGLMIGFMTVLVFLLPLDVQGEKKKEVDKTAKKAVDKTDEDKKEPEKKEEKKEVKKKAEKLLYGIKFATKIQGIKAESNREYLIEIQEKDPVKVANVAKWAAQRQQQLAQQAFDIGKISPKDMQGRFNAQQAYNKAVAQFQAEMAKQNVYTPKNVEVRAIETAKVRTMIPPIEFDDAGFQKKWTKKELDALRDKNPLHLTGDDKRTISALGFPTDFDAIKQGSHVEIYMVKVAPMKKEDTKKKKGPADDDPPAAKNRADEFVLIVILPEGK